MNGGPVPDPNDPKPTPDNPNPEPARPPSPPETPQPTEPPGIPPPSPDPVPAPEEEPIEIPPGTPPEVPSEPSFPGPTAVVSNLRSFSETAARTILLAAVLSLLGAVGPVAAQTEEENTDRSEIADPCQMQPEQDNKDQGEVQSGVDQPKTLERCKGVFAPPKIGDAEFEEPAPNTGTTPTIPPESVPEQPPE